jgi:hypothetical protein
VIIFLRGFWPTCCSLSPKITNSPPTGPARAEIYDLICRSIVSMAVFIFSNDLPARILASA